MLERRHFKVIVLIVLVALTAACDKAQLLAPTQSTITVSAPARVLPSNGTTPVTASVLEQAGTPVQNGTTVRFTTTLGHVDPVEVQTTNGLAITTFFAGPNSGIAEIQANSGAATGGAGSGTGNGGTATTGTNVIRITIGAAAVNTITLRANPGTVSANGGTVELIATVVGENGQPLQGVLVTFNARQGSLDSATAVTNTAGEARTTLTTSQETVVSATAGTKTSSDVTVTVRSSPIVSITCAVAGGGQGSSCAAVPVNPATNTATVTLTVSRGAGSTSGSALRSATIDFGDGTSQALGSLSTSAVVNHTYEGPASGSNTRNYTATVVATDVNGETASVSTAIAVTRSTSPISVNLASTPPATPTQRTARWTFTATVTPTTETATIQTYTWDFDDGSTVTTTGNQVSHVYTRDSATAETQVVRRTVTVTARSQDGRSGRASDEIVVTFSATPP